MNFAIDVNEEVVAMDAIDDIITGLALGIAIGSLFFC